MKRMKIAIGIGVLFLGAFAFLYQGDAKTSVLSVDGCDSFSVFPREFDANTDTPVIFQILEKKPSSRNFEWSVQNGKLTVSTDTRNAVLMKWETSTVVAVSNGACRLSSRARANAASVPLGVVIPSEARNLVVEDKKSQKSFILPHPPFSPANCEKLEILPKHFSPDIHEQAFTANIEPAEFNGVVKWTHSKDGKAFETKTGFRVIFDELDSESKIKAEAFPNKSEGNCNISALPE